MPLADPPIRGTVLFADDDPGMRRLIRTALRSKFYEVLEAANGAQAWQLIRGRHPDVAILDWEMPCYTGLELAAIVKGDPLLCGIYVIMISERTREADILDGKEAGVNVYITKPFSPVALLEAVAAAFSETRR